MEQHVQLPNTLISSDLTPQDLLVYVSIKRYMNNKTKIAYPSLKEIQKKCKASIDTIRKCVKHLEEKDFISIEKKGRAQKYHFNPHKEFEPFSYEFLDKEDLSFTEKSYILASQQFMFKDVEGMGKISFTNKELSTLINMTESTISRTNKSLERKNYLTVVKDKSIDPVSGCNITTKVYNLQELGQAIIWKLKEHEDKINQNSSDIEYLKNENQYLKSELKQQRELLEKFFKKCAPEQTEYLL